MMKNNNLIKLSTNLKLFKKINLPNLANLQEIILMDSTVLHLSIIMESKEKLYLFIKIQKLFIKQTKGLKEK